MELRHFKYFVAVAEELNFTRAAVRLGIGQPHLSQQIKDVEAELDIQLLRRVPHGAVLTEAGQVFLLEARHALTASEIAVNAARRAARGELGRLRLGFTSTAHFNAVVPMLIRKFGKRYRDVHLELEEANTFKLVELLAIGTIDVALTHSRLDDGKTFNLVPVRTEPLVAVVPSTHPKASGATIRLADLMDEAFIIKPHRVGPALFETTIAACRSVGFEPRLGPEAPQLATVISFVAAGLGVSLVPDSMRQFRPDGVTYLAMEDAQASVNLSLVWRRQETSSVVRNFVALARALAPMG